MNLSIIWIVFITIGIIVLKYSWYITLDSVGFKCPQESDARLYLDKTYKSWGSLYFIPISGYAFLEEMIFRLIPIYLAMSLFSGLPYIGIIIIFSAQITFGYMHGNEKNIVFQGVSGILYVFLFILFGGLYNPLLGVLVTTAVHLLWNLDCQYNWVCRGINYFQSLKLGT